MPFAESRARDTTGESNPARMAIMPITTSISINVKRDSKETDCNFRNLHNDWLRLVFNVFPPVSSMQITESLCIMQNNGKLSRGFGGFQPFLIKKLQTPRPQAFDDDEKKPA